MQQKAAFKDQDVHCQSLIYISYNKEVIQPQVPLRLPCYDFIPVTIPILANTIFRYVALLQTETASMM